MTTHERIQSMSDVRRSLRALNYKMRKMNRLVSYTTLMDSWFELRGNPKRTRTMTEIVTSSQKRWMQKPSVSNITSKKWKNQKNYREPIPSLGASFT